MFEAPSSIATTEQLTELAYELLDAHDDTARLVEDMASEPVWALHLDYLRGLQRVGREVLGKAAAGSPETIAVFPERRPASAKPAGPTFMYDTSDIPPGMTIAEFRRQRPANNRPKRFRRLLCGWLARAAGASRLCLER